jgi:hypothetical protein
MTEKSILEQALLHVQTLEEAVKQNAKGILASTMKQELSDLLKEQEEEEEEEDEVPVDGEDSTEPEAEEEDDMSGDLESDSENEDDLDNDEPTKDIDSMDSEDDNMDYSSEDMDSEEDEMEFPSEDMGSNDDVMDMTGASDEEVLRVFRAMKPEDGIVVKKDGNDVELDLGDDEYIIKLDEEEMSDEFTEGWDEEEMSEEFTDDETIYEIELDDEDDEVEMDTQEAARTFANQVRKPANHGKKFKAGRPELNEELSTLKKQNKEYKKALILFKEKLNEVAVFNANLAYATRLFTEHSTTKQEKLNILKRFDSVSTMNESKNLFSTIKSELENKKPITESVVEKISSTPTTSYSQILSESKAYENEQFKRIKDLFKKIK